MVIRVDPEQNELRALKQVGPWQDKMVLEVGCGDGRLTLRLATLHPKLIHAIDPNPDRIRLARKNIPSKLSKQVHFKVGSAGDLKYPSNSFDYVVFSWVL